MSEDLIGERDLNLTSNESYRVYKILNELRENVGDSEFGYRVQGLFAATLVCLGMKILEIKSQGHPDVIGMKENEIIVSSKIIYTKIDNENTWEESESTKL